MILIALIIIVTTVIYFINNKNKNEQFYAGELQEILRLEEAGFDIGTIGVNAFGKVGDGFGYEGIKLSDVVEGGGVEEKRLQQELNLNLKKSILDSSIGNDIKVIEANPTENPYLLGHDQSVPLGWRHENIIALDPAENEVRAVHNSLSHPVSDRVDYLNDGLEIGDGEPLEAIGNRKNLEISFYNKDGSIKLDMKIHKLSSKNSEPLINLTNTKEGDIIYHTNTENGHVTVYKVEKGVRGNNKLKTIGYSPNKYPLGAPKITAFKGLGKGFGKWTDLESLNPRKTTSLVKDSVITSTELDKLQTGVKNNLSHLIKTDNDALKLAKDEEQEIINILTDRITPKIDMSNTTTNLDRTSEGWKTMPLGEDVTDAEYKLKLLYKRGVDDIDECYIVKEKIVTRDNFGHETLEPKKVIRYPSPKDFFEGSASGNGLRSANTELSIASNEINKFGRNADGSSFITQGNKVYQVPLKNVARDLTANKIISFSDLENRLTTFREFRFRPAEGGVRTNVVKQPITRLTTRGASPEMTKAITAFKTDMKTSIGEALGEDNINISFSGTVDPSQGTKLTGISDNTRHAIIKDVLGDDIMRDIENQIKDGEESLLFTEKNSPLADADGFYNQEKFDDFLNNKFTFNKVNLKNTEGAVDRSIGYMVKYKPSTNLQPQVIGFSHIGGDYYIPEEVSTQVENASKISEFKNTRSEESMCSAMETLTGTCDGLKKKDILDNPDYAGGGDGNWEEPDYVNSGGGDGNWEEPDYVNSDDTNRPYAYAKPDFSAVPAVEPIYVRQADVTSSEAIDYSTLEQVAVKNPRGGPSNSIYDTLLNSTYDPRVGVRGASGLGPDTDRTVLNQLSYLDQYGVTQKQKLEVLIAHSNYINEGQGFSQRMIKTLQDKTFIIKENDIFKNGIYDLTTPRVRGTLKEVGARINQTFDDELLAEEFKGKEISRNMTNKDAPVDELAELAEALQAHLKRMDDLKYSKKMFEMRIDDAERLLQKFKDRFVPLVERGNSVAKPGFYQVGGEGFAENVDITDDPRLKIYDRIVGDLRGERASWQRHAEATYNDRLTRKLMFYFPQK